MRQRVRHFYLQPTPSFELGPQRELFATDAQHATAAVRYETEWRATYLCDGCGDPVCPQCRPTEHSRLEIGTYHEDLQRHDVARFSLDDLLRYTLTRELGGDRVLACCGLNPSTATAFKPDNTIRRDIGFARSWGFGRIYKVNAYAYRTKKPKILFAAAAQGVDIVGAENDLRIREACQLVRESRGEMFLGWGTNCTEDRQRQLAELFREEGVVPKCWKTNEDGSPAHELYAPGASTLQEWICP